MRNETLKNLLLTASLISASAFLTACGDDAKDPAKSASQTDKIKKEEADVLKTRGEAIQTLTKDQNAASETVKKEATEFADVFKDLDIQLPAKVEKASADAMLAARKAYLDFDTITLPKTLEEVHKKYPNFTVSQFTTKAENLKGLALQLKAMTDVNAQIASGTKVHQDIEAQIDKLSTLLVDRVKLKDQYIKEVNTYYSPSNYGKEADIKKRDTIIESVLSAFEQSQKNLHSRISNMYFRLEALGRIYDQNRADFKAKLDEFGEHVTNITALAAGDQANRSSLSVRLDRDFFGASPIYNVTALFHDSWARYFLTIKDKLLECSLTKKELAIDIGEKFKPYITVYNRANSIYWTLEEWSKNATQEQYQNVQFGLQRNLEAFFGMDSNPWRYFFQDFTAEAEAEAYSAETVRDISSNVSLRQARTAATGLVDGSAFKMNGVAGQSVELGMPLFIQLKGDVSSAKATEATTGSVAYRLGNTVIGAIQGYANSGTGFGTDSRQLETSVVASQSFGSFFIEGQIGTVSATDVHFSDWKGMRSQLTLGLDTEFVSPFVQVSNRQLNRGDAFDLNETTAYIGLDMNVAKLSADTYSIDTRLLAKAGYGSKDFSANAKALGSTTGFTGTVEWSASLNINSGVAFSSNLALDTTAGSSAGLTVSLDR